MEFRGSKISERPVHLQTSLDKALAQVADDLLSDRLTRKKRRKADLNDRPLASSVVRNVDPAPNTEGERKMSDSSESSVPQMPILIPGLFDDAEERAPPMPTPPIRESSTWDGDPPVSSSTTTHADLKQQALHLIHRTPSRRG